MARVVSKYTLALCGSREQGKWQVLLKMVPVYSLFIQHLLSSDCAPGARDAFVYSHCGRRPLRVHRVTGALVIGLRAVCCAYVSPEVCFLYTGGCLGSKSEALFLFQGPQSSVCVSSCDIMSRLGVGCIVNITLLLLYIREWSLMEVVPLLLEGPSLQLQIFSLRC